MRPKRTPRHTLAIAAAICLALPGVASAVAPTIDNIGPQTIDEDPTTPLAINFNVADTDTDDATLTVSKTSSNPSLVPVGNIVVTKGAGGARTVTITPLSNQFGTTTIRLTVSDGTDSNFDEFTLTVNPVNDRPTIDDIPNTSTDEDQAKAINFSVGDVDNDDSTLTFVTKTSSNTTLVPNSNVVVTQGAGGARTVTLTPAANKFGTTTITLTVSDGVLTATDTFVLTVDLLLDDPPAIVGAFDTVAITDNVAADIFGGITDIIELDQETVTATVTLNSTDVGKIISNGTPEPTNTWSSTAGLPATVLAEVRALRFLPESNRVGVGQSEDVTVTLAVQDNTLMSAPPVGPTTITVTSVNDPPTFAFASIGGSIPDDKIAQPLRLTGLADPDPGETFSATLSVGSGFGTLSAAVFEGTAAQIQTAVQNVRFTPSPQTASVTAEFTIAIIEVHAPIPVTGTPIENINPIRETVPVEKTTTIGISGVNDEPEIVGVNTTLIRITDEPTDAVLPFAGVRIDDLDLTQQLTVTVALDQPALGRFVLPGLAELPGLPEMLTLPLTGTASEVTRRLQLVKFVPVANVIPVGQSQNVTLTITATDGSVQRVNNQTVIVITSINAPPAITYSGPDGPGPRIPTEAILIDPALPIQPFAGPIITITDDDPDPAQTTLTVTIDNVAKGIFDPAALGGFQDIGSGAYRFVGTPADATTALSNLIYRVEPLYLFPANAPGGTTFSIRAVDSSLNQSTDQLSILIQDEPLNHLVTETEDDPALEGTLRHAIENAGNNDTITFALASYPARIRLDAARGAMLLDKNLTLAGPGADKLAISGDSNGNGQPDTQLLRVVANVRITGVSLEHGTATQGGCVEVGENGVLALHACTVAGGIAQRWGGGIDVKDGSLIAIGCLFTGNTTDPSFGSGGGAVSLWTDQPCAFINSTFSGNAQASENGVGGGAIYAENSHPQTAFDIAVSHCTFAENSDASDAGSSICSNVFSTMVELSNSIFADGENRNLHVLGAGGMRSMGGNISDDSTRTTLTQSGVPRLSILLSHKNPNTEVVDDQIETNPLVEGLTTTTGPTRIHPLNPLSPAIGSGVVPALHSDQLGALRDSTPDSGAAEFESTARLVINEIHFNPTGASSQFIEFYNPRNSQPVALSGFTLWIDGAHRHTFPTTTALIQPGFGILVADDTGAINSPANLPEQKPSVAPFLLELGPAGSIELRSPDTPGQPVILEQPVISITYNGVFANAAHNDDFLNHALTLVPQFVGSAYVPSGGVRTFGMPPSMGFDPTGTEMATSPGADSEGTEFGEANARPNAVPDAVFALEDRPMPIDVLDNDIDADGFDLLDITQLSDTRSTLGAAIAISPGTGLGGELVSYDPREATLIQRLPVGVEATDTFTYSIIDFGAGSVVAYEHDGTGATKIVSPAHRLTDTTMIEISGASDPRYNGSRAVTFLDDDSFSIPVSFPPITRYEDAGSELTRITAVGHLLADGDPILISGSTELGYNGTHLVSVVDGDSFTIAIDFTIDPGVGNRGRWLPIPDPRGSWVTAAPRARPDPLVESVDTVTVTVVGVNDSPAPFDDVIATNEDAIIRIMGDPDLVSSAGLTFDTDDLYPFKPSIAPDTHLLANDSDVDSDENADGSSLRVVGVTQAQAITAYSRADGGAAVAVSSENHGLVSGAEVLISRRMRETGILSYQTANAGAATHVTSSQDHGLADGDTVVIAGNDAVPSYNGLHAVTVVDGDTFTIEVAFGGDVADGDDVWGVYTGDRGYQGFHEVQVIDGDTFTIEVGFIPNAGPFEDVWAFLSDADRLNTLSEHGAEVVLEIRADRIETNIVYNAASSSILNKLALTESETDTFWYAVEDSHGEVSLAQMTLNVAGRNDATEPVPDPEGLAGIAANLPGGTTLADVLAGAGVDFVVRGGGGEGDVGLAAILIGDPPQTVFVDQIWVTDEATEIAIPREALTGNDFDVDTSDTLSVTVGPKSTEKADLELTADDIVYKPRVSARLRSLAREEWLIDTFVTTISDSPGGGSVTSLVAVLVEGLNEAPVANDDPGTIPITAKEDKVLTIAASVILQNDTDVDQDTFVPDDVLSLIAHPISPTAVEGAFFSIARNAATYDPTGSAFLDGLYQDEEFMFDTFDYTATDGSLVFATDDLFKIAADVALVNLNVLYNDSDLTGAGGALTLVEVGQPSSGGFAEIAVDGTITYAPPVNFVGDDYFTYTVSDSAGRQDRALVVARVTIDQLNGNLQANNDSFSVAKGQEPLLNVLANDNIIPANGQGLSIERIVDPETAQVSRLILENGAIRYTPPAGMGYRPEDGLPHELEAYETAGAGAATKVTSVAHGLATDVPIIISGSSDESYNGTHLVTVIDPDAFTVPVAFAAAPAQLGTWIRDPEPHTETFSYEISGGGTARAIATVRALVMDREGTLNIRDDALSVLTGSVENPMFVLANDNILPGSTEDLTITEATATANASVEISPDKSLVLYTPNAGFVGDDSFTYEATDSVGGTGMGTVSVKVGNLGTTNDFFAVAADGGMIDLDVLANDQLLQQATGAVTIMSVTPENPDLGVMAISDDDRALTFIPASPVSADNEHAFTYTVRDGADKTVTGTVTVAVIENALSGSPDFFSVQTDSADNQLDVLLNDAVAPDRGRDLTIVAFTVPPSAGGSAEISPNGRIVYSPLEGFSGEESFAYSVTDGVSTDTATVVISVRNGALRPAADSFTVYVGSMKNRLEVLANDRVLPDGGQQLTITGVGIDDGTIENNPSKDGDAEISADGLALEYTPRDLDAPFVERFTYEVSDGTSRRAEQTVTITVLNRTSARFVDTNDDAFTVLQDSASNVLEVLANDNVLPASAFGWEITDHSQPNHGALQKLGNTLVYSPPEGFVGTAMFTYFVSDGVGGTGSANVVVKVGDNRVCDDQFIVLSGSDGNELDVLANDGIFSFPNELPHEGFMFADDPIMPVIGSASVIGRKIVYTPGPDPDDPTVDYVGIDSFVYWVVDDSGGKVPGLATVDVQRVGSDRSTATVSVTVIGVNDLPVIEGISASTTIIDKQTTNPFAGVTLTDVDRHGEELLTLRLSLSGSMRGILFHPGGLFEQDGDSYVTTNAMTPADATKALNELIFQPTPDGRVSAGDSETTTISLEVSDPHATTPPNTETTVTAKTPPRAKILPLDLSGADPADDSEANSEFGKSIAMSGDTMAVGSPLRNENGIDSGAVFIYERTTVGNSDRWQQSHLVVPEDPQQGDRFGASVALDGDTLVVGAPLSDDGANATGSAYVFERNAGAWVQTKKLVMLAGRRSNDRLGTAVAVSGDTVLVGALFADRVAVDSGVVLVFERDPDDWELSQELVQTTAIFIDWFGGSVAIDGNTAIVGAYGSNRSQDESGFDLGAAYIFERDSAADPWQETNKLEIFDIFDDEEEAARARRDENFGWTVDIHGDTAVVGTPRFDPTVNADTPEETIEIDAGAAFIFGRNQGVDGWGMVDTLTRTDAIGGERFGQSVAVNEELILVGTNSISTESIAGFVNCYRRDIDQRDNWRHTDTLLPPDPDVPSRFGFSVALDTDSGAVGAIHDRENAFGATNAGAVFVSQFALPQLNDWDLISKPWLVEQFTLPTVSDPTLEDTVWGLYSNPDGDTYINLFEFLHGTDPNVPDPPDLIQFEVGPTALSIIYPRSKDFPPSGVFAEWSSDVKVWSAQGISETIVEDRGQIDIIRATVQNPGFADELFMRLKIGG